MNEMILEIAALIIVILAGCIVVMYYRDYLWVAAILLIFFLVCYARGGGFDNLANLLSGKNINNVSTKNVNKDSVVQEPVTKVSDSEIVNYARQFVGNPYVWGGSSLTNGCDCSHYVWLILLHVGYYKGEYRTSLEWAEVGEKVNSLAEAQAGDIIVYADNGTSGHVAIYDGNGKILEARGEEYGIIDSRDADHGRQIVGIRRFHKLPADESN